MYLRVGHFFNPQLTDNIHKTSEFTYLLMWGELLTKDMRPGLDIKQFDVLAHRASTK